MNRMALSMAVLAAGLVALGGCSTAGSPAPTPAASSAATSTTSAPPSPPSATPIATTATAATTGAAFPAADLCTYLAGQIPALTAIGSPVGVQANLAGNLFSFFQSRGIPADGTQLDAATTAQCPQVRSQILTLSGLPSLAQL